MITLTKNGFREFKKEVEFDFGFLKHWRDELEIEEGVTLADLVKILRQDEDGTLVAIELLTNSQIRSFFDEIEKDGDESSVADLKSIEVYKSLIAFVHDHRIRRGVKEKQWSVRFETNCCGRFKEPQPIKGCPGEFDLYAGISGCSWADLKNLPLVLNYKCLLRQNDLDALEKYKLEEPWFSVGEFFNALTDELCFFGDPENRDAEETRLKEIISTIDFDNLKGRPAEEVFDELKERLEKLQGESDERTGNEGEE